MDNQFNQTNQNAGVTEAPQMPQKPVFERLDRKLLKSCRHKSERKWYRFLVIINIIIIVAVGIWFAGEIGDYLQTVQEQGNAAVELLNDEELDDESLAAGLDEILVTVSDIPESVTYAVIIIFTLIALPFAVSYAYAQYRSMSVRITEKTYPEIYAIVEEYSQKLGLKRVPKIYMVQGNGTLNAFSTFIPFRQYIEVYADLLEVAYREHHDMATMRFIIGHEMGHIYYKHSTMHYYYSMLFSNMIPILSQTASRAREYSCDRLAQLLSGSDGVDAMMALTAGIHLYKSVDRDDYVQHAMSVKGLFVFCYNLVCDHPVTTKRVLALVDPNRKSGKLFM